MAVETRSSSSKQGSSTYFGPNQIISRVSLLLPLIPPQIRAAASGQSQFASCAKTCAGAGYALTLIGADYSCRCAGSVAPAAALLWDTDCEAGGTGIAAFYNHADAATPCHVEDVPLANSGFKAAYNAATNVKFAAGREVHLVCFQPGFPAQKFWAVPA